MKNIRYETLRKKIMKIYNVDEYEVNCFMVRTRRLYLSKLDGRKSYKPLPSAIGYNVTNYKGGQAYSIYPYELDKIMKELEVVWKDKVVAFGTGIGVKKVDWCIKK